MTEDGAGPDARPRARRPATNKTRPTTADVNDFLADVAEPRRADAQALTALMADVSGEPPTLWGSGIVGFGSTTYRYESGREGTWMVIGFAPRKTNTTVYFAEGLARHGEALERLGPHTTGKGCLYVKRLAEVDLDVLREMVESSYRYVSSRPDGMHRAD